MKPPVSLRLSAGWKSEAAVECQGVRQHACPAHAWESWRHLWRRQRSRARISAGVRMTLWFSLMHDRVEDQRQKHTPPLVAVSL